MYSAGNKANWIIMFSPQLSVLHHCYRVTCIHISDIEQMGFTWVWKNMFLWTKNKTKYFRLRLTDKVISEIPKRDLRLTLEWPGTDQGWTWDWPKTDLRLTCDRPETDLNRPETDLRLTQTTLRWRLRPLDNFVPNRRTDRQTYTQTEWLLGLLDGAKFVLVLFFIRKHRKNLTIV